MAMNLFLLALARPHCGGSLAAVDVSLRAGPRFGMPPGPNIVESGPAADRRLLLPHLRRVLLQHRGLSSHDHLHALLNYFR